MDRDHIERRIEDLFIPNQLIPRSQRFVTDLLRNHSSLESLTRPPGQIPPTRGLDTPHILHQLNSVRRKGDLRRVRRVQGATEAETPIVKYLEILVPVLLCTRSDEKLSVDVLESGWGLDACEGGCYLREEVDGSHGRHGRANALQLGPHARLVFRSI